MGNPSETPARQRQGGEFLCANRQVEQIKEIAEQVADKDVPVLILGESGVGKEVVARHIHARSERRERPFVKINCAALPHGLLESELFGHEKGAFTGATQRTMGQFEVAADGTVLLDEIGEMDPVLQAKLLHVLQDKQFKRVGGKHLIDMQARVIATTNKNLDEAVAKREFREDLFFRLAVITLEIPPLRRRREDILPLAHHFLATYSEQYGSPVNELPEELSAEFLEYHWPGNVRELQNLIRRYVLLPDHHDVMSVFESRRLRGAADSMPTAINDPQASLIDIGVEAAERAEKEAVLRVLEETNWNRKEAAQRLNVCYKTLLNKLNKWRFHEQGAEVEVG